MLQTLAGWALRFFIMPLFSKLIVWLTGMIQDRIEESRRNAEIDEAIKKYKEAVSPKEQENAFKDLIRNVRHPRA